MGILVAVLFLVIAVAALAAFGGTPHAGPTSTCGPIDFFGYSFTVNGDCRYVSFGEVAIAVVFFILAVIAALAARPRPRT
jgi:hypothetical protein